MNLAEALSMEAGELLENFLWKTTEWPCKLGVTAHINIKDLTLVGSLEKSFMLFFAVVLNSISGILAGMYQLSTANGWLVLFPLVNIINSVVLFSMFE
jgi:hypothetical protein